jgi:hypothetical protein
MPGGAMFEQFRFGNNHVAAIESVALLMNSVSATEIK